VIADFGLAIALWIVGVKNQWVILYFVQKLATWLLAKFIPLSKMMVGGSLKRHTMFRQRNLTIYCPMMPESNITFTHLVKQSVTTSRNLNWGSARRRGPTMSSPHCLKGQGLRRVWRSALGLFEEGANIWHCEYFFTYSLVSSNVLG